MASASLPVCLAFFALFGICSGRVRNYFVVVNDIEWDYSDYTYQNLIDPQDQDTADIYFKKSCDRIGSAYKKTTYFEYTDETFTTEIPKPAHLGLIGPMIRGEVGDAIHIKFFNNATGVYSMHAHGVFYLKEHEGALYLDGTSGRFKTDEIVMPGDKVDLVWNVTDSDAPEAGDPPCLPWVYHSHVDTVKDTSAGLLGFLVTCKKGVLDENNQRTDVDLEYPILLKTWDENLSWHIDDNIDKYCEEPNQCRQLMENEDEDFTESNYMRSINGRMFGHLSGLQACVGDRVAFYVIGFGNEFDVHSLHFHGQNLKYHHTRGDTISVFSATFVAAETVPKRAGYWLMTDMVGDNEREGMAAFFFTRNCAGSNPSTESPGVTREYFLAAEEILWDYGPTGIDGRSGNPLTFPGSHSEPYFKQTSTTIGGVYKKAKFVQYADNTFITKMPISPEHQHLGILGPVLRLGVGDTLKVTLKNKLQFPVSFLPHALSYNFKEEASGGAGVPGGAVPVNKTHTYYFQAPANLLQDIPHPCQNYLYTSAHDPSRDHNTGLVGTVLVCRKDYVEAQQNSEEFFLLLTHFDENKSLFLQDNIKANIPVASRPGIEDDEDFTQSNLRFSINGYSFGNLPNLTMCLKDNVTWYVMSLGSDLDVHTVAFDGNTFVEGGKHRDVRELVPGSTAALQMAPDNAGLWAVQSHSNLAKDGGMYGFYNVGSDCSSDDGNNKTSATKNGIVREFFIAAEEVEWDFAPLERSLITGADMNDPRNEGNIFIRDDEKFIGDTYKKAVFRAYLDSSFMIRMPFEDILGPAIKVEVGDTIKILFKNAASRPYSMHAHGVMTSPEGSGVNYIPGTGVPPGNFQQYTWEVPERSGPGPDDPNCIPWLYFSAVDPVKDTNSGLVGPLVVCREGTLDSFFERKDVDREFFILMSVINENLSWYLDENVKKYAPALLGTDYRSDPDFEESNKMHSINGRVFGNNPDLYMEYNSKVAWYMMSVGGELDLHTIHLHGHTFVHTSEKHRDDIIQMFPGMAESIEMVADNPGTWLLHCHVLDHISAGMETTYTVLQPGQTIPNGAQSPNLIVGR